MVEWLRSVDGGVEIRVWVVPGASRSSIDGLHGSALKVRVTAPPERGKANAAVADLLSATLGTSVTLVAGTTSRTKTFFAHALPPDRVRAMLL